MLTLRRASRVSTLTGGTGDYAIAWKCPSNSPSTPHRGWGWMGMDGPESPIHPHPKAHPSPSKAHPKCVWMGSLRAVTMLVSRTLGGNCGVEGWVLATAVWKTGCWLLQCGRLRVDCVNQRVCETR